MTNYERLDKIEELAAAILAEERELGPVVEALFDKIQEMAESREFVPNGPAPPATATQGTTSCIMPRILIKSQTRPGRYIARLACGGGGEVRFSRSDPGPGGYIKLLRDPYATFEVHLSQIVALVDEDDPKPQAPPSAAPAPRPQPNGDDVGA